jgi:GNAT superfamily N-acetyltransferase
MILRPPTVAEHPFVFAGWIRSCRYVGPSYPTPHGPRRLPIRTWEGVLHARIERLMGDCVAVADEGGALVGFVAAENVSPANGVLHYVYVEHRFRRRGVAKAMLDGCGFRSSVVYTHVTDDLSFLVKPGWVWDPTALEIR